MLNKRGDMSVGLFVILTLFVLFSSLFIFGTKNLEVENQISESEVLDSFYLQTALAKFYIEQIAEAAFVESYREILENGVYVEEPAIYVGENIEIVFDELNSNLDENFKIVFVKNFKIEFERYDFEELYMQRIKQAVAMDNFNVSFNGDVVVLDLENFGFVETLEKIEVRYNPKLNIGVGFRDIGVDSFNEIYTAKEKCKGKENIFDVSDCMFGELEGFNTLGYDFEDYDIIEMKSKRDFVLGDGYRKVNFRFALKD